MFICVLTRSILPAPSLPGRTCPPSLPWHACSNCDIGACKVGGKGFSKPYAHAPDPISADVCPTGTMFPAQFKNGAGDVGYLTGRPVHYSIVDQVRVPAAVGDYVLSWRWDCEETNQVWNSCADIRISADEPPTPPPPPAPPAPPAPPPKPKPGKGCKAMENPTCKGLPKGGGGGKKGTCVYYGCKKCHDDVSWDCDECCDACARTFAPKKGVHYCADKKAGRLEASSLPGFMLHAVAATAGDDDAEDPLRDADPGLAVHGVA